MMTHAVEERLPGGGLQILVAYGRACGLRTAVRTGDGKILLCLASADTIYPKRRTCRQSTDFLIRRKGFWNATEQTESNPTSGFLIAGDLATGQQRLDLGCKAKGPSIVSIVERLNAVGIPRQQQGILVGIPETDRKHAPKIIDHCLAFFGVKVQQDLSIRLSAKYAPARLQRRTQFPVIVDLPIKCDDDLAVGAHHRLRAAFRKVDNGQPAVP